MNIAKHTVASINYTLKNQTGEVLESSDEGEPLAYVHGVGSIISGLETALEGKKAGDKLSVSISPQEAYGLRDEQLVQVVPTTLFAEAGGARLGMRFRAESATGVHVFTVVAISGDEVTVDANHPLAGETLNFDVTVVEVRAASDEEVDHGHVHGAEGHGH